MAEPLLVIENVHAGYGDVRVLWGVSLTVARGEIACLVGSNGAGKTTLMRTLSGLVRATEGVVRFDGRDLSHARPSTVLEAGIAHVPEGRRLFAAMSVRNNLLMGAYRRSATPAHLQNDLERVYGIFPILADRRNQAAGTLSGGEQQMCAVARGIMSAPKLLLIDELSLGLAPRMVDVLCEALQKINRDGLSLFVVEQDVTLALEIAHRGFVMDSGRITRGGLSAELASDPAVREAYLGTI